MPVSSWVSATTPANGWASTWPTVRANSSGSLWSKTVIVVVRPASRAACSIPSMVPA